jgi:dipeptidyl aminopeptidase/acylaminoacyl peptidase
MRMSPSSMRGFQKEERNVMERTFRMLAFAFICALMILSNAGVAAEKPAATADIKTAHIDAWLMLGPFPSPAPAFMAGEKQKFDAAKLLSYEEIALSAMKPAEGASQTLLFGSKAAWRRAAADTNGVSIPVGGETPAIAYFAAYVEVSRWTKASVSVRSSAPFRATIDGAEIVKSEKAAGFAEKKSGEAKLERGKHLLLVKTVRMPSDTSAADWRIDVSLSAAGKGDAPVCSVSPARSISLNEILYHQTISRTALSPDGSLVAINTGRYSRENDKRQSWLEIRRMKDGSLERTIRDVDRMSNVQWAPVGKRLSYVIAGDKDTGTLRLLDLDSGECSAILENVSNLDDYLWARDGSFIVYTVSEKAEPDKRGLQHLTKVEDRQRGGGDRSYLYVTTVPGGETRRLTAGRYSTGIYDVHPDGNRILMSRGYEDLSERPYGVADLYILNLEDQSVDSLWKGRWLDDASFSPDGTKILIRSGPSAFGNIGLKVSEGTIPNDYDGQLYLFDIAARTAEPLTRDFDPAVTDATWSTVDGNIYVAAEVGSKTGLFRCNPKKKTFERIETGFDVSENGDIARSKLVAVDVGSSATAPPRLYAIDLAKSKSRMIYDPNAGTFAAIELDGVEDWSFTSSAGTTIDGYYYLPPGFDPQKKYPCIVYYYGGTSPVNRAYGGRYPKNLWAAEGYVVYVLQPSGATGYGQEFSAAHVNDWGKVVAGEIIEGAKKFVEAHPFVDGARLGCIGASYGGFMTELLVTKTDMFAAAVSHAGISSISSYWGEGYWGYGYNAVAAANSFPWNRRDIYVDQSPLFSADKIKTPLLLTHGGADTNVPTGESEQLFTALKLLGKNVEYLKFDEQDHFILEYKKRVVWSNSIIAWFDRFLKDEPEWWNELWPPEGGEAAEAETPAGAPAAEPAQPAAPVPAPAKIGVKVIEKQDGSKVVLGDVTRQDIVSNIAGWDAEYYTYQPDATILGDLAGRLGGIEIVLVLGTWCSDSHQQVPRLWKVLDSAGFSYDAMKTFAVERAKAASEAALPQELIDWSKNVRDYYAIKAVESVIVYRNGVELGRFVEAPAKSIEAYLLEILNR